MRHVCTITEHEVRSNAQSFTCVHTGREVFSPCVKTAHSSTSTDTSLISSKLHHVKYLRGIADLGRYLANPLRGYESLSRSPHTAEGRVGVQTHGFSRRRTLPRSVGE